jgi:hypothetical protein
MSARSKRTSRFQDLSREQAFGLEARVLQRLVPLLQISEDAQPKDVQAYFTCLFDLTYLLAEIGLGNQPLDSTRQKGKAFHSALNKYGTLISEKSTPAADAILCVTDALGELGLIRYFPRPELSERDQANPDVGMLVAQSGYTLSKIGMLEEVFAHPAHVDAEFIFNHKSETEPFLPPAFFSRYLWPLPGLYSADQAMPYAFESVIMEDWRESITNLGLGGIVASYNGFLHGMNLVQNNRPGRAQEKTVINNVTINLGNGSTFTGPVSVGENIRVSYSAATSASGDQLRQRLEEVVGLVSKLTEAIDSVDKKNDVSVQLKSFVEEAKKDKPSKWMLDISSNGLLEAAKTVAEMAAPVTTAVKAVLELIAPSA